MTLLFNAEVHSSTDVGATRQSLSALPLSRRAKAHRAARLLRSLVLWMRFRGRRNWRPASSAASPFVGIAGGASMSTSTPSSRADGAEGAGRGPGGAVAPRPRSSAEERASPPGGPPGGGPIDPAAKSAGLNSIQFNSDKMLRFVRKLCV